MRMMLALPAHLHTSAGPLARRSQLLEQKPAVFDACCRCPDHKPTLQESQVLQSQNRELKEAHASLPVRSSVTGESWILRCEKLFTFLSLSALAAGLVPEMENSLLADIQFAPIRPNDCLSGALTTERVRCRNFGN